MKGGLMPGTNHPKNTGILRRQVFYGYRRSGRCSQRGQEIPPNQSLDTPGVGIKENHGRLMIGQAPRLIFGPIPAGLQSQCETLAIEP